MERFNRILNSGTFKRIAADLEECEREREFCRHEPAHFIDTARICYMLILEDKTAGYNVPSIVSKELIYTAGLLHDIGRIEQYRSGVDHAHAGAEMAAKLLGEYDFIREEVDMIVSAIKEHRKLPGNPTYLGEKLYKADKMSRECYRCQVVEKCYNKDLEDWSSKIQY